MKKLAGNKNNRSLRIELFFSLFYFLILSCHNHTSGFTNKTNSDDEIYEVWVVQEFWHTGIIFPTEDVDPGHWPEIENYQDRNFVDVGWGDEKFYQATGNLFFLAARAILWPTQSVLQIFAFNTPVRSAYGGESRVLRIPLNSNQFAALSSLVSESYIRDEEGNIQPSTVYGESDHFFLATGKYYLFKTCNTWVAIAFRHAGLDVRSFCVLNANQLFRQLSGIPGAEFID